MTSIRSLQDSLKDIANRMFGGGAPAAQPVTDLTMGAPAAQPVTRGDGGRRPHSEAPAPGTPEDAQAKLGRMFDLQQALANERRLQAQRVAALADCEACTDPPASLDDLTKAMDQAKKDFEDLQNQLKAEAGKQLAAFNQFTTDYDKLWTAAMRGSDKYFEAFPEIKGLDDLLTAIGDREWAGKVAGWIDTAIQAAQMGVDAYHLGAGVVKGLAAAGEGAAGVSARAAGDLAEREGARIGEHAVQDAASGERAAADADRAAQEAADAKAAQAAHEKELNAAIEKEAAAARAERQAADDAAAKAKAADAPPPQDPAERTQAIKDSGMTADHGEAFSKVAGERDEVILTQKTNPSATDLIDDGAATKNMHIKGKSANSGPAEGYIPTDQSLSPKVTNPTEAELAAHGGSKEGVLDYYNKQVQKCIDDGYAVEKEVIGKDGTPVKVLADPKTGQPITADYDLLGVGTKKPGMVQVPDPDLGNITAGGRELKDNLNQAVVGPERSIDNPVVHHGAANEAPVNPGVNYPVTAYEPSGNVVSIKDEAALKDYFNTMNAKGYSMQPHPDWGWSRGTLDGKWH
jgi:hypothetical protein